MSALEKEPETYYKYFTKLTKGINKEIHNWIIEKIPQGMSVLEVGCGPGTLSNKLSEKKVQVIAFDKNLNMIMHAIKTINPEFSKYVRFQLGSATNLPDELGVFDFIITTFMIFELRPFEQQIFLRYAWDHLKPNGHLIIADEFIPKGIWRLGFNLKRLWYKRKLKVKRTGVLHPLKWFLKYLDPIGFEIKSKQEYKHGAICVYDCVKKNIASSGYYQPPTHSFEGTKAGLRVARCLLTGQIDHIAIEPGIYKSGNPDSTSPIVVTSNYEYTYIKVMKDLKGLDAWVLCVDSNGINVWCAARGGNFGNRQLIEAVQATGIERLVNHKTLIVPQLAAGGISLPQLPNNFPFKIKYGPIWSKYLKRFLKEMPPFKPEEMRLAKFSIKKRLEAGITHTTFLLRKFLILPAILLGSLSLVFLLTQIYELQTISYIILVIIGWIFFSLIVTNLIIPLIFPLANFSQSFIIKGIFLSIFPCLIGFTVFWIIFQSILNNILNFDILNLIFLFWLGFFSTMSFSGYTFSSSPRKIRDEYSKFQKINNLLLILLFSSTIIVVIFEFFLGV